MDTNQSQALNSLLRQFAVAEGSYTFRPLTSGLINDTFLVVESDRPQYVLQRINNMVFENVEGLMRNFEMALQQLSASDYQDMDLIKTLDGKTFYQHKEENSTYWRLVGYIENTVTFNTTRSEQVAFEAGRIIGRFHTLLQNLNTTSFIDTIPQFHSLKLRQAQFYHAITSADSTKLKVAKKAISFAEATIVELVKMQNVQLPIRICHNDTKLNNILFSAGTNRALCLIDLDTLMAGHFLYDFGDAVRTIANTAPEDERDHSKITFEKPLFDAFLKGLAKNGAFLYEKEIESLPSGAVLMPFLHGLRALTDYLDNNRYYKVSYENQNLDRAESLFCFTQKSLSELGNMKKTVKETLTAMA